MTNNNTLTPIPQNYKNNVDWILGAYTDADVTFANGFQKDAIQNAAGARKTNSWKNWRCDISLHTTHCGQFVVVEDSGTVGLTGENRPANEINRMMARGEKLESSERLSRFTSMFNSGGNTTGGGLFGAGKSVYSVASDTYTYYFDSLREDGKYVANINKSGQVHSMALEGNVAKSFIYDETGLPEKTTVGTRVIIEQPRAELIEAIVSGEIVEYIRESWWLIIGRLGENSAITVNGIPVEIPTSIKAGTRIYELDSPEKYATGYKVKHFGLYVFEDGSNPWTGVSYYRKGMKIGEVDLKDIPAKLDNKFWGYIEVDESWEQELADIEDKVHFGVSKGKKRTLTYQYLKNYCNNKINIAFVEWGYIKDKENEDKKLKDELKQIAEDIQDLFDQLGFEDLGKGPKKPDFDVRWKDIQYPVEGIETVTSGDEISFTMRIKSMYLTDKKFTYRINVVNPISGTVVSTIEKEDVKIKSNSVYEKAFSFVVSPDEATRYAENKIVLSVKVVGSGNEKIKELPFYYDIEKPDNTRENITLALHGCEFPTEGSRRVDFGQCISNVCYRIDNKRNKKLKYRLNISIHNASDSTSPKIIDVCSQNGEVEAFEDCITPCLEDIKFEESVYKTHIEEGVLELRARLIAAEADDQYEKGDKITYYHYKLFLNCDEKHGKHDAFEIKSVEDADNYKRAWFVPGNARTIYLNVGHVAYLNIKEYPEIQHEYLREQMLKQYVLLYLAEGKYDMFGEPGKMFVELEPQEAADQVIEKIEKVYSQSLK